MTKDEVKGGLPSWAKFGLFIGSLGIGYLAYRKFGRKKSKK